MSFMLGSSIQTLEVVVTVKVNLVQKQPVLPPVLEVMDLVSIFTSHQLLLPLFFSNFFSNY